MIGREKSYLTTFSVYEIINCRCQMDVLWALWCRDAERGDQKYLERNLIHSLSVHHKLPMNWPGVEPGPWRWRAHEWPPDPCKLTIFFRILTKFGIYQHIFLKLTSIKFPRNPSSGRRPYTCGEMEGCMDRRTDGLSGCLMLFQWRECFYGDLCRREKI